MKTESLQVEAIRITDAPALDPIIVVFHDVGPGQGRIIIECFGMAWSAYWGGMGSNSVREFVVKCGVDYLTNALRRTDTRSTRKSEAYLSRILTVVQMALSQPGAEVTDAKFNWEELPSHEGVIVWTARPIEGVSYTIAGAGGKDWHVALTTGTAHKFTRYICDTNPDLDSAKAFCESHFQGVVEVEKI